MKGAQIGLTTVWILKTTHGMIYGKYPQGAFYLFPTSTNADRFGKSKFSPLIAANPFINRYVRKTDTTTQKQIGDSWLFLVGAREKQKIEGEKASSDILKTESADLDVFDEYDEMSEDMVELALYRLNNSKVGQEAYLSTPSIPEFGIHRKYLESDQRVWMIKCQKCGHETCLEKEFPHCMGYYTVGNKTKWFRKCMKCDEKIFPRYGRWVAQYPDRSQDLVGWWISALAALHTPVANPTAIMNKFHNPPEAGLAEVYNSFLGMPYIDAEHRLTPNDVFRCACDDLMVKRHDGPTCMGVDIGSNELHVVVAAKTSSRLLKVVYVAVLRGEDKYNLLHDLAKDFNCKCMVMDMHPETHKVKDFQRNESYAVWLCSYQKGEKHGPTTWHENTHEIHANRTEILDASHELVKDPGRLEIPRIDDKIKLFASQVAGVAKALVKEKDTKSEFYRYKNVGNSGAHYRHTLSYCMLASTKISRVRTGRGMRDFFMRVNQGTAMTS